MHKGFPSSRLPPFPHFTLDFFFFFHLILISVEFWNSYQNKSLNPNPPTLFFDSGFGFGSGSGEEIGVQSMAADVVRILGGYKEESVVVGNESGNPTVLITRDLLGGGGGSSSKLDSQELDLDLKVPDGWEKRLDLKSGKVYLQRCNSLMTSSASSSHKQQQQTNETVPPATTTTLQDLNFPPNPTKPTLTLFDDANLDLKLVSASSSSFDYPSVCTLDKVKSALERAERSSLKKRSSSSLSKSSSSPSHSDDDSVSKPSASSPAGLYFAAGCPGCLLYVLISKSNPKCPRCNLVVPTPAATPKKPRIDLNISI